MRICNRAAVLAIAGIVCLGSSAAKAALIIDPTGAASSLTAGGADNHFGSAVITRATDSSGLSSALANGSAVPAPGAYPTDANSGHPAADYLSNNTQSIVLTFDLGNSYVLGDGTNSFHLYNYNEGGGNPNGHDRGIQTASIYYEGAGGSLNDPNLSYTLAVANKTFLNAPGLTTYQGDDYADLNGITARFVRFVVTASFKNLDPPQGDYTGISEIRFIGTVVPEPASWGLLALGGLLLLVRRRVGR